MMVGCVACLLTDASDPGSCPHVAKRFFQRYSMTNNASIIYSLWYARAPLEVATCPLTVTVANTKLMKDF